MLGVPGIDACKVDVFPTERRDVLQQHVGNIFARLPQMHDSTVEIDRIPVHNRADDEIEAGCAKAWLSNDRSRISPPSWKNTAR